MEEIQQTKNNSKEKNDSKIDEKLQYANIFSNISKFEKNKRYQQLQKGLSSLKNEVKLMEDFINNRKKLLKKKNNFPRKINISPNNDKDINKRNLSKAINRISLRKRMSSLLNQSNNLSNSIIQTENSNNNNNNKINKVLYTNVDKNKGKKILNNINKSQDIRLESKKYINTEINNENDIDINGEKLPNIYMSIDKMSDSNIGSINTNTNSKINSSVRLPKIQARSQRKYFITENDYDKTNSVDVTDNHLESNTIKLYKKIKTNNLKRNSIIKKYPNILNSSSLNKGVNGEQLTLQTDRIVKDMKDNNLKIKNKINYKLAEQNMVNWEMKSKFKMAQWKYGIAEIQKYFVDLQAFGKPEEDELVNRKTFYDLVEDLIDDIKLTKEEKEIKSIEDKYTNKKKVNKFGNLKKKEDKKNQQEKMEDEMHAVDNTIKKRKEISKALKNVLLRQKKEKEKRDLIEYIMFKSDLRKKSIYDSTEKLIKNKNKLNKSNEKNEKSKRNEIDDNETNNEDYED